MFDAESNGVISENKMRLEEVGSKVKKEVVAQESHANLTGKSLSGIENMIKGIVSKD